MVKNPAPKTHFFEKTHKTQFQKKMSLFQKKKSLREYPSPIARWVGGAGPGPNINEIGKIWSR